ncbi:hypothetical protein [Azospirillum tabaci]|uniref:hypothetical protein n=1 Tax=Azospirillum tabaci TaxID=2752310 RepID=UPI0016608620|nr:hypothetical protein [Azospirillum tabaci]
MNRITRILSALFDRACTLASAAMAMIPWRHIARIFRALLNLVLALISAAMAMDPWRFIGWVVIAMAVTFAFSGKDKIATGAQCLGSPKGGITPRLNADGSLRVVLVTSVE